MLRLVAVEAALVSLAGSTMSSQGNYASTSEASDVISHVGVVAIDRVVVVEGVAMEEVAEGAVVVGVADGVPVFIPNRKGKFENSLREILFQGWRKHNG